MKSNIRLIDLGELFFRDIYPVIGNSNTYEIYMEKYYYPNKVILDFHFSKWREYTKEELKETIVCDGMADYFTSLFYPQLEIYALLNMKEADVRKIEENEALYWNKILRSLEEDDTETTIVKFNGTVEMRRKFGINDEIIPERMSYYYGLKIIKALINKNKEALHEMTFINPEVIFNNYLVDCVKTIET